MTTHDVTGSNASGSDSFDVKRAEGRTFTVAVTATDAKGDSGADSETVAA